ncbi:MAG: hypothetical protein JW797_19540 [Bradymonadales bacterium]|nr:hypothetical protein [Bradymonadales bacterium]
MLSVYLITAIVGGVFVLLSAFGGHQDADGDAEIGHEVEVDHDLDHDLDHDVDHDLDHDLDHEVDAGHPGGVDHPIAHSGQGMAADTAVWLPFFSTRFWTYFLTFFGVTGLVLTPFAMPGLVSGLIAGGMGLTTGLGAAYGFRYLKRHGAQSGTGVSDLLGAEGRVLVRVSHEQLGKIRCRIKGKDTDLLALADDAESIEPGARVLIIDLDETTARVVRVPYGDKQKQEESNGVEAEAETRRG